MQASQISSSVRENLAPKNPSAVSTDRTQGSGVFFGKLVPPEKGQLTNLLPYAQGSYEKAPCYASTKAEYGDGDAGSREMTRPFHAINSSMDICQLDETASTVVPATPRIAKESSEKDVFDVEARKVFAKYWSTDGIFYYCMKINNVSVCRRSNDSYINGTKLLNAANLTRGRRDGMLKKTKDKFIVRNGIAPLRGVWIPLSVAQDFAKIEGIEDLTYPLLENNLEAAFVNNPQFLSAMSKKLESIKRIPSVRANSGMSSLDRSPMHLKSTKSIFLPSPVNEAFKNEKAMSEKFESLKSLRTQFQPTPKELQPKPTFSTQQFPPVEYRNAPGNYLSAPFYQSSILEKCSDEPYSSRDCDKQSKNYSFTSEQTPLMNPNLQNKKFEVNPHLFAVPNGMPIPYLPHVLSWPYMQNFPPNVQQEDVSALTVSPQEQQSRQSNVLPQLQNSPSKQNSNYNNFVPPNDFPLHLPYFSCPNYPYFTQYPMHQNPN